ncbi:hypothetical protein ACTXGQ_02370 [Marinobacter sp. 1Y8]
MEKMLGASNTTLLVAVLALIAATLISYPFADQFTMPQQVGAHLGILFFAIMVKLSYIARLVCLRALGRPVH